MKKLIVIGIVVAMVMGLSAVAFANADNWIVDIHVGKDASGADGTSYSKFGIKTSGASQFSSYGPVYDPSSPEIEYYDSAHAWAGKGVDPRYYQVVALKGAGWDPSVAEVDYNFYVAGAANQAVTLYAWNPTGASSDWDATKFTSLTLWTVDGNGVKSDPYAFDYTANGGNNGTAMTGTFASRIFNIDPAGDPQRFVLIATTPEPGSMAALFTGLVGLVGFGIRRRR
jgi:hypothetical protein